MHIAIALPALSRQQGVGLGAVLPPYIRSSTRRSPSIRTAGASCAPQSTQMSGSVLLPLPDGEGAAPGTTGVDPSASAFATATADESLGMTTAQANLVSRSDPSVRTARSLPSEREGRPRGAGASGRASDVLVEAAGVEPASGGVTGEATPCSASSWFSPPRLEKRQNSAGATPNTFRRDVRRSGAATPEFGDTQKSASGALTQGRGYCWLSSQSEIAVIGSYRFSPFNEVGEASACNLSRARPRRSRFAPTGSLAQLKDRTGMLARRGGAARRGQTS